MARPHTDFLQSQTLPWQPSRFPHLPGCQVKLLSQDPDSGAQSLIVRFPSGWATARPGVLGTGEELLVLEGALELDGRRFGPDGYGWFPPGSLRTLRTAPDGAVALVFFDGEPTWTDGAAAAGSQAPIASLVDAFELPWMAEGLGLAYGGAGRRWKVLHGAPHTGPATLLIASPPHLHPPRWCGAQEIHACAVELFVLSGDLLSHAGQLCSGAYCWRPAGIAHGPYGSRGGNLAVVRTHGARFSTDLTAYEIALPRAPEYRPLLPPELRSCAVHPWRPQRY
jgi:hypothetical protein